MESGPPSLASGYRPSSLSPFRHGMGSRRVSFDGDSLGNDTEPSANLSAAPCRTHQKRRWSLMRTTSRPTPVSRWQSRATSLQDSPAMRSSSSLSLKEHAPTAVRMGSAGRYPRAVSTSAPHLTRAEGVLGGWSQDVTRKTIELVQTRGHIWHNKLLAGKIWDGKLVKASAWPEAWPFEVACSRSLCKVQWQGVACAAARRCGHGGLREVATVSEERTLEGEPCDAQSVVNMLGCTHEQQCDLSKLGKHPLLSRHSTRGVLRPVRELQTRMPHDVRGYPPLHPLYRLCRRTEMASWNARALMAQDPLRAKDELEISFVACHWIADSTLGLSQAQMVQRTSEHVMTLEVDMVVIGGDLNF
eukprot:5274094-Amphidinium_carterae.2